MELSEYKSLYDLEESHWLYRGLRGLLLQTVKKYFAKGQNVTILDAGCGTGYNLKYFDKYGVSFGVDISPAALTYCRERGLNRIVQASVLALAFPDESFDMAVSIDVLYHNAVKNDSQAISELYRILKNDGILIINLPAHEYLRRPHDDRVHTRHRYNRSELLNKLRKNNFKVIKASYRNMLSYPIIFLLSLANGKLFKTIDTGVKSTPGPVNRLLYSCLKIENMFLKVTDLPFGISLFCVSKK